MKITKIEKKKRLYLLEIEDCDILYVTEDTIVRFLLTKGMDITPEQLKEIQDFAQFSYGKNLALYHISFKQRTKKEVSDYLYQHDIDSHYIPQILDQLEKENWLNDKLYAKNLIQQNATSGDKGPHSLTQKLSQKGIEKRIVSEVLADCNFSNIAERVAKKLYKKYQDKLPLRAVQTKLLQNLTSRGFTLSQAKAALTTLELEKNDDLEEELIYKELEKQHRKYVKKYDGYELKQRLTQALARKGFAFDDIQSALREFL